MRWARALLRLANLASDCVSETGSPLPQDLPAEADKQILLEESLDWLFQGGLPWQKRFISTAQ